VFNIDYETDAEVWDIINATSMKKAVEDFCYLRRELDPGTHIVRVENYENHKVKTFKAEIEKNVFVTEDDE
jgi:hypothetical protein